MTRREASKISKMTYEQALAELVYDYEERDWDNCMFDMAVGVYIRCKEALEKQIPKKPIWEDGHCYCPHKHESVIKGVRYWTIGTGQAYCDFCGQAIDWSDDNED